MSSFYPSSSGWFVYNTLNPIIFYFYFFEFFEHENEKREGIKDTRWKSFKVYHIGRKVSNCNPFYFIFWSP